MRQIFVGRADLPVRENPAANTCIRAHRDHDPVAAESGQAAAATRMGRATGTPCIGVPVQDGQLPRLIQRPQQAGAVRIKADLRLPARLSFQGRPEAGHVGRNVPEFDCSIVARRE